MRIGVDARVLLTVKSGLGRYTSLLLNELTLLGHEWFIYSPQNIKYHPVTKNISFKSSSYNTWMAVRVWEQTVLPYWAAKDKVDLLWSPAHRLPLFLSKKIARVVTIHDLVWRYAPDTMRKSSKLSDVLFMPLAVKAADVVIAVSKHTLKDIKEVFPESGQKAIVVYEGVTPLSKTCHNRKLRNIGIRQPYILFVGTIEPRKNLTRLLEAFSMLPNQMVTEYQLIIAGAEGWGNVNIQENIKGLGLEENVRLLGYVKDSELADLYKNATLHVMPSLYEGFGLPLLEAMSVGIPVLTSNLSAMPEIVGDAGVLVDPYDVESISQGIFKILSNISLQQELSRRGIARSGEFTWRKAAHETLQAFEKALDVRRAKQTRPQKAI